jgi:hypothetical protein
LEADEMKLTRTGIVAVLALLVGAGAAAAAPGTAPTEAGQSDDAGPSADAGPPSSLPDQVPDFVTDVLGSVGDFTSGSVDQLGEVVRSVTPGGPGDAPAQG